MQSFEQYTPTKVVFGKGAEEKAGKLLKDAGASKVFVVYGGGSVVKNGILQRVRKSVEAEGIGWEEFPGAKPNPLLSHAREGVRRAIACKADYILAIGGGSAIDTAKAIALGAAEPDTDIWEFWLGQKKIRRALPVGAVLTLPAAGSEMSDSAVLTEDNTGYKAGANADALRPQLALMNPELTYTLPRYQVACGVVDILMHTLERYFTPVKGNELTDEIAEGLMRTVIRNGEIAYKDPTDYDAMSELMWCGSLSHNGLTGLGRPKDFAAHKLGHGLSGMFDKAHGATLSATWGSWARYVYHLDKERFARYGRKVWGLDIEDVEKAAIAAIERTEAFFRSLQMPACIGELGIGLLSDEVLKKLSDSATKGGTVEVACFRKLSAQDLYEIYKAANHE